MMKMVEQWWPDNFFALEKDFDDYEKAKVVILRVPYGGTASYGKGTEKGPDAMMKASQQVELFDEELEKETYKIGIATLPSLEVFHEAEKSGENFEKIYLEGKKLLGDDKFIVMVGGEHSISPGLIKAYKEKFNDLSVLQIDAHSDLRDEWENNKFSHACAMKRVIDLGVNVVQVGIRSTSPEEQEDFGKNRENIFMAKDIQNKREWMDVVARLTGNVFVTIDVDGLDPSIMPSTGTPEPGGLLWYDILSLLKEVAKERKVVGFDVVELAPVENLHAPDFLCAKLIYRLLGYVF